jgi:NAD(P)H-dependent FMN reductase
MSKVAIVIGSTRPGRRGADVARWVHGHATRRDDAEYELIDLADVDLPLLDEPVPPSQGDYSHSHTIHWAETVSRFDAFVFVTPEYNHGIPAALKNAIDFLYAEWNDKAAGFVGYGSAGGVRAVEQLRQVMGEVQIADVRSAVALSLFTDWRDFSEFAPADHQEAALDDMLDQLGRWARALHTVRVAAS